MTDEVLANAFRKYSSFQKAKALRDKHTGKTKGFGFVSFAKADDYARAMKEMNGKYIGNRPVKLLPSKWKDRAMSSSKSALPVESIKLYKRK